MSLKAVPVVFSLSNDDSVEAVLADIPYFCAGLMAFGVLTFLLFVRRLDLITIYLYISSFVAFVAAVLDLGQTLVQGKNNALSPSTTPGLIVAREVGLALSVGFLYIFLWCLVAQCPRGEQTTVTVYTRGDRTHLDCGHSASWERWGVLGLLLKWTLLGLSFSIPVLQIVWRVSAFDIQPGTVYISEATIEVVVSALFILKLFLNIFLSPLTPRWLPIQLNIVPATALLISGGLGIGNLASLAFSERTLGRFLRAIETYILILFVLIIEFYNPPGSRTLPGSLIVKELRSETTWEKPSDRPFVAYPTTTNGIEAPRYLQTSTKLQLPSRVPPGDSRRPKTKDRLYTEDVELGVTQAHTDILPADTEIFTGGVINEDVVATNLTASLDARLADGQSLASQRPLSASSILSYYATANKKSGLVSTRKADSPIYGLNGIVNQNQTTDIPLSHRSGSIGSFDELLRQQTELDKSIAALRLFSSSGTSAIIIPGEAQVPAAGNFSTEVVASTLKRRSIRISTLSYVGRKPDSASNRSEFSLSYFPEPPAVDRTPSAPTLGEPNPTPWPGIATSSFSPIGVPEQESPSLPASPSCFEQDGKSNSPGTQYDVTSFVDGQPIPVRKTVLPESGSTKRTRLSDPESKDPNAGVNTIRLRQQIPISSTSNAQPLNPSEPTPPVSSLTTRTLESVPRSKGEPSVALRPILPSAMISSTLSSNTKIPINLRRKNGGLPGNPRRPPISRPLVPLQDGVGDDILGVFERPRPAPPSLYIK